MNITDFIKLADQPPSLRFLVIGGYAVGVHGYHRSTYDIDFLVFKGDRDVWIAKLQEAGLQKISETTAFAQFSQKDAEGFDLMFVSDDTFEQMWAASLEKEFDNVRARLPHLDHLLALKLHALKQKVPHRTGKDATDVEQLIRLNRLDISQPLYENLFLKYGTAEIYETFLRILRY